MANYSIVEDPRPRRQRSNHPCHLHSLRKTDMRDKYSGMWRCDLCNSEFNSRKSLLSTDSDEADPIHAYHCHLCNYDLCSVCFKGHIHPFHHHRLKKAQVSLIYPETGGQWRCDACQRVFTELTAPMSNHCPQCEIDICDKCFKGEWKHVLHTSSHSLKPVDPRLEYRKYITWFCDACRREFTGRDSETFFNCSVCQYDLCSDCFHGEKHHLHQHPLSLVSKETHGGDICSNCSKFIVESQYRKCKNPNCCFSLCGLCYLSPPRHHPYHRDHPLVVSDADVVYPQSGGLWHCDNCTNSDPFREQKPLPASQPMYHCETCDYDLCESCYKRGYLDETRQTQRSQSYQSPLDSKRTISSGYHTSDTNPSDTTEIEQAPRSHPYHQGTNPNHVTPYNTYTPGSYAMVHPAQTPHYQEASSMEYTPHNGHYTLSPVMESLTSLSGFTGSGVKHNESAPLSVSAHYSGGLRPLGSSSYYRHSSMYGGGGSSGMCVHCGNYTATKYFCHGTSVMTCTAKPVACERCAGEVMARRKPCPACGRIPDGVSDISF